jgi:hypothetical protein
MSLIVVSYIPFQVLIVFRNFLNRNTKLTYFYFGTTQVKNRPKAAYFVQICRMASRIASKASQWTCRASALRVVGIDVARAFSAFSKTGRSAAMLITQPVANAVPVRINGFVVRVSRTAFRVDGNTGNRVVCVADDFDCVLLDEGNQVFHSGSFRVRLGKIGQQIADMVCAVLSFQFALVVEGRCLGILCPGFRIGAQSSAEGESIGVVPVVADVMIDFQQFAFQFDFGCHDVFSCWLLLPGLNYMSVNDMCKALSLDLGTYLYERKSNPLRMPGVREAFLCKA